MVIMSIIFKRLQDYPGNLPEVRVSQNYNLGPEQIFGNIF